MNCERLWNCRNRILQSNRIVLDVFEILPCQDLRLQVVKVMMILFLSSASKISWRSRKHFPPSQWGTHSGLSSYVQFSRLPSLDRVWRCMKTKSVSPVCFKSVMSFGTCTILWQFHVIRRENSKLWFLDVSCIVEYSDLESCLSFKFALIRRKNQLEELPHRSLLTIWCYVIPIRRLAPSSMFDFKAAHVNVYSIWSTKPTKKRLPCMVP